MAEKKVKRKTASPPPMIWEKERWTGFYPLVQGMGAQTWAGSVGDGKGERADVVGHHAVRHVLVALVLLPQLPRVRGRARHLPGPGTSRGEVGHCTYWISSKMGMTTPGSCHRFLPMGRWA